MENSIGLKRVYSYKIMIFISEFHDHSDHMQSPVSDSGSHTTGKVLLFKAITKALNPPHSSICIFNPLYSGTP